MTQEKYVYVAPRSRTPERTKLPGSPYYSKHSIAERRAVTEALIDRYPIKTEDLAADVVSAWEMIFDSRIGPARIGTDIFPAPQIIGFFLHELVPMVVAQNRKNWRRDASKSEKDMVYIPDDSFSTEIKTSSNAKEVYGNRSYGQKNDKALKDKSGYYLTINFQKWQEVAPGQQPKISLVRFGWVDSSDWVAQSAGTGQNSRLLGPVYDSQLAVIYSLEDAS